MSRILEKLADQHEERIINVLYKLEEDVVKEVTRATFDKEIIRTAQKRNRKKK